MSGSLPRTGTTDDSRLQRIHASLHSLGAPSITLDELSRLNKGSFGEILLFLSDHVKGRADVEDARTRIQSAREKGIYGHRDGVDDAYRGFKRAQSDFRGAKHNIHELQMLTERRQKELNSLHEENQDLQASLENKQLVLTLLDVLRKKEDLRRRRFQEMTKLLEGLRVTIVRRQADLAGAPSSSTYIPSRYDNAPNSTSYARDTLSTLHAYHIYLNSVLSQRSKRLGTDTKAEVVNRVTHRVGAILQLPSSHDRVKKTLTKLIDQAARKSRRTVAYRSPFSSISSHPPDPRKLTESIRSRERTLQSFSDQANALIQLSDGHIHAISTFTNRTSTALSSLLDETKRDRNLLRYVDVLAATITSLDRDLSRNSSYPFGQIGVGWDTGLKDLEEAIRWAHQREQFLSRAVLPPRDNLHEEAEHDLIDQYKEEAAKTNQRSKELLERKTRKAAEIGGRLVSEVEEIVREIEMF